LQGRPHVDIHGVPRWHATVRPSFGWPALFFIFPTPAAIAGASPPLSDAVEPQLIVISSFIWRVV
jgi:hypothetical protein